QTITNSGTLLGNQGLTIKGNSLNNASGKVFSGGDMLAEMVSLSGAGQLVALGNLTLVSLRGSHLHSDFQSVSITDIHSPTCRR
ncbi:hypothetical protein FQG00_24475, partial [Escherichia coli]|nr:hypothetical protein [Escherichia coli]